VAEQPNIIGLAGYVITSPDAIYITYLAIIFVIFMIFIFKIRKGRIT